MRTPDPKPDFEPPTATMTTPAMRLQVLSTEHWSLLASRSLAWSESFSRAGMFLSTLSFAMVALALVAQASSFGPEFRLFALVILPVVLFLGISTMMRLDNANYHDFLCVIGMNRIRAEYLQLSPDLRPLFVMGTTDDIHGIRMTMGIPPGRSTLAAVIAATPFQLSVLNSVLVGAILGLLALHWGGSTSVVVVLGAAGFLMAMLLVALLARRQIRGSIAAHRPMVADPSQGDRLEPEPPSG